MLCWDVYNDNVGVVSVCRKDEFRVDDIKKDGYLVINDSVIKDVVNSKDDYNDNVSITNIEVVIEKIHQDNGIFVQRQAQHRPDHLSKLRTRSVRPDRCINRVCKPVCRPVRKRDRIGVETGTPSERYSA